MTYVLTVRAGEGPRTPVVELRGGPIGGLAPLKDRAAPSKHLV